MRKQFLCALSGLVLISKTATAGCMDTDTAFWRQDPDLQVLYTQLMGLMACPLDADAAEGVQVDATSCNWFAAKALQTVYKVQDFAPEANGGRWLLANEMATYIATSPFWHRLGTADDAMVLADAQNGARNKQPVVAFRKNDPHGHIALILPGVLQDSTTWGMKVPNSASGKLLTSGTTKAYVFCRLSAAFSKESKSEVEVYYRDYP